MALMKGVGGLIVDVTAENAIAPGRLRVIKAGIGKPHESLHRFVAGPDLIERSHANA